LVVSVILPDAAVRFPATFRETFGFVRSTSSDASDDAFSVTAADVWLPADESVIVTEPVVLAVSDAADAVTLIVPLPDVMFNEVLFVSVIVEVPLVLTDKVGAFVFIGPVVAELVPMLPAEDSVSVPLVDIDVEATSVIDPEPCVVNVTLPLVALKLPATFKDVPEFVKLTARDAFVEPFKATTPEVPADESVIVTEPVVFAVSDAADAVTLIVLLPEVMFNDDVFVSVMVEVPLVLTDKVGAFVVMGPVAAELVPMSPATEDSVSVPLVEIDVELASVIVPAPCAVKVTLSFVALKLPATFKEVPEFVKLIASDALVDPFNATTPEFPADESVIVTEPVVFAVSDAADAVTLMVPLPEAMFNDDVFVSVMDEVPLVLTDNVGAFVVMGPVVAELVPMLPATEDSVSVPLIEIDVEPASVIAPEPCVDNVTLPFVALKLPATFKAVPEFVKFTARDAFVEPFNATTPDVPVDESVIVTEPVVLAVSDAADAVTLIVPLPEAMFNDDVFVSVMVEVPPVLTDNVGAFVVMGPVEAELGPMLPETEDSVSVPLVEIDVELASVIAPEPCVVNVKLPLVALKLPATFKDVPVFVKLTARDAFLEPFKATTPEVPAAESVIVTEPVVLAVSDAADAVTLIVPLPDEMFNDVVFVSVMVEVPLVLTANVGAFVVMEAAGVLVPMLPEPDDSVSVPLDDINVELAWVIAPILPLLSVAASVTEEPWTLANKEILPPFIAWRLNACCAMIVLLDGAGRRAEDTLMFPGLALSVKEKLDPVEAPEIVTALRSVMFTEPVVLTMS
jgi:hypothetical protein